ncbi:MAG: polyprenyl synthetase family protein [Proteobacteria bacterium]|nr:polyprenyl synthetase family protein [Pseudomonadota bacterium]
MSSSIKNPFTYIKEQLSADLKSVDDIIISNSSGKSELIGEITQHLVLSGGKRVRPILTILGAKACGYKGGNRHHNLAAAIELIHSATLLHDDVVDGSLLRRGKKTSNSLWGNKASILVGDYLLSIAFQLMVKDGSLETLDILSNTSGVMSNGEILQLTNSNDIGLTEDKYLEIIYSKTAILFSSALKVGAIVSGIEENQKYQKHLGEFGNNLGMAFQIADDVLDYCSDTDSLGKEVGNDFFEGKVTLPIIITYQAANEAEKAKIKDIFSKNLIAEEKDESLFQEIMSLVAKYDAINKSMEKALQYAQEAKKNLDIVKNSEEKAMLIAILEYSINRKN